MYPQSVCTSGCKVILVAFNQFFAIASIPMLSQIAYLWITKITTFTSIARFTRAKNWYKKKEKIPTVPLIFQFDIRHHCCVWYFEKWSCIFFLELNIFSQWLQGISTPSTWCASICLMMSVASPSFQHTLQVLPSFCLFLILNFLWLFSIIDLTASSKCCKSADTGIDMANALFSILLRSSICSFLVVPEYDIFWFVLYFCVCLVCISVSLD